MSLPQTGAATVTYNQVRDWVIQTAGFGNYCPVPADVLTVLLSDSLQQIYAQVWKDPHYQQKWEFSILEGNTHVLADAVYELRVGGRNEIQEVAINATGGTFTLTFSAATTAAIAYNASTSTVQAALEALAPFDSGDIEVTGGPGASGGGQPYVFTFTGQYANTNVAQFTASGASLTGGAGTATPSTTQAGSTPSGGTFTITVDGATTSSIAWNATPAVVQSALEALSTVAVGDVEVTGGIGSVVGDFPYRIEFKGLLAGTAMTVSWVPSWSALTTDLTTLVVGGSEAPTSQIFDPMFAVINKFQRLSDGVELWEAESFPVTPTAWPDGRPDPTRVEWKVWGDEFGISEAPETDETYRVFGYRKLNRVLFTYSSTNPNEIIWNLVDLPANVIDVYQKVVLGFVFAAADDTAASGYWLRVASDELAAILGQNGGKSVDRVPQDTGLLVMGGTPRRSTVDQVMALLGP